MPSPSFVIHSPGTFNNAPALFPGSLGNTGTNINVTSLVGNTIVVTPKTANQTYTLPTSTAIANRFGSSLRPGQVIPIRIVNKGSFTAYIASNATGGDGTAVTAYTGSYGFGTSSTGASAAMARSTLINLEFVGPSGAYGIYV